MSFKDKLAMLETIFEIDSGTLAGDVVLDNLEEWDSLSKLALKAEVAAAGRKLSQQEIEGFITVQDICDWLD